MGKLEKKVMLILGTILCALFVVVWGGILYEKVFYQPPMEIHISRNGDIEGVWFPPLKKVIIPKAYPNVGRWEPRHDGDKRWEDVVMNRWIKESATEDWIKSPALAILPDGEKIDWLEYVKEHPNIIH